MKFTIEIEAECEDGENRLDSLKHREKLLETLLGKPRQEMLREQVEKSISSELEKVKKEIRDILRKAFDNM